MPNVGVAPAFVSIRSVAAVTVRKNVTQRPEASNLVHKGAHWLLWIVALASGTIFPYADLEIVTGVQVSFDFTTEVNP